MSRTEEFEELRTLLFMLPPSRTRGSTENPAVQPMAEQVI